MSLTLTLRALALIASVAALLGSILNAPEGHEDENGFHAKLGVSQPAPVPVHVKVTSSRLAA